MHFGRYASRKSEARYPNLWNGLIRAWCPSVQGASGNTIYDLVEQRHAAFFAGTPSNQWTSVGGLTCANFDGLQAQFLALGSLSLSRYSISGWFVADNSAGFSRLFSQPSGFVLEIGVLGNTLGVFAGSSWQQTSSIITFGEQYRYTLTAQGTSGLLYVNGNLVLTPTVRSLNGAAFVAGWSSSTAQDRFNGKLDDLMIHNRALRSSEVRLIASDRGVAFRPRRAISFGSTFRSRRGYSQIFTSGVIG